MDLNRVDLNLLVSLDVLLAECNVTRAAARLSLSQPALSAQLKQLRAIFADPLLLPAARGMVPSPRALALQAPLREMLAALANLLAAQQPFDPAQSELTFRIATTDSIQSVICVPLAAHLRQVAPRIRLALTVPDRLRFGEQMASGELDLTLVTPQAMPSALKSRPLYAESFQCVMRRDHPAAGRALDLQTFCQHEHILVSPNGGGFHGTVDETLAELGISRRVVVSVTNFLLVPALVAASDLICTVPARLARQWRDSVCVVEPPCAIAGFAVHMGWHPRSHADPAQAWLRAQILTLAGEAGSEATAPIPSDSLTE